MQFVLKLSLLKPNKLQHITVLLQRKTVGLLWNFLKYGTQKGEIELLDRNIHFGGKFFQFVKCQTIGLTLRGLS